MSAALYLGLVMSGLFGGLILLIWALLMLYVLRRLRSPTQ